MKRDLLTMIRLSAATALIWAAGCQQPGTRIDLDDPDLSALVALMLPAEVEVQSFTKPVSFVGDGNADGLEVILATRDSFGDEVKAIGMFQFELRKRRLASASKLGERIAYWTIAIRSLEPLREYWDPVSHFYVFPLKLETGPLAPGPYVITARLRGPTGRVMSDEYPFTYESGRAPPVAAGR